MGTTRRSAHQKILSMTTIGGGGVTGPVRTRDENGCLAKCIEGQPFASPQEYVADFTDFASSRVNLFLQEVYEEHLHHNNGSQLDGGDEKNDVW